MNQRGWAKRFVVCMFGLGVVLCFLRLTVFAAPEGKCDIDGDDVVDRSDIEAIVAARSTPAGTGDPRDVDGDGTITVNDARLCTLGCTKPTCSEIPRISDLSPGKIEEFLKAEPVKSAAAFLKALPDEFKFKQHWIMMTRSESVQTGTATYPRILLPSQDSSIVFGFALAKDVDFPQADPNKIEYLQFDDREGVKKFRFHLIDVKSQTVTIDDPNRVCFSCHRGRPNWDAYDSWGGMLPFNRDRIYKIKDCGLDDPTDDRSECLSEEAKAFKRLLEDLRGDPIVSRLDLPKGITRDGNGNIRLVFDRKDEGGTKNPVNVRYKKGTGDLVSFPGPNEPKDGTVTVTQGGRYLRLHHSGKGDATDEGRATALFDNFTKYNAQRVAQDLLEHPRDPVDIRPIALAIAKNCDDLRTLTSPTIRDPFRSIRFTFLRLDTEAIRARLPKLKADLQAENLAGPHPFGLIRVNRERGAMTNPLDETTITQEVFRRSNEDKERPGEFLHDTLTGFMIDRERNPVGNQFDPSPTFEKQSRTIALFRFLLEEPFGVQVSNWSMSVLDRSLTYTFGDQFSKYTDQIRLKLEEALTNDPDPKKKRVDCDNLINLSKTALRLP